MPTLAKVHEPRPATEAKGAQGPESAKSALPVLSQALVAECQSLAMTTAVVTSGANSLIDDGLWIGPSDLQPFVPRDLDRFRYIREQFLDSEDTPSGLASVEEFIGSAEEGSRLLDRYFAEADHLGPRRAGVLHFERLSRAWRQTCAVARDALDEVASAVGPVVPELHRQNDRILVGLLAGAGNGWRPCIDSQGRLIAPPLPQQRRWPRLAVFQDCQLVHPGGEYRAFVRDVSAGGLGLDRVSELKRGTGVIVIMESGRRFVGSVAWCEGSTAGIKFPAPLPASDPMLCS